MYEPVIGLEVHAQISTKSKMFCRCSNDSFGKEPNTNVCPICMGFPGMLPYLNEEALHKGVVAALALHCEIPPYSKFDRKNYFYPDLPKGFQISQYDFPISKKGYVEIIVDGKPKRVILHRLHLEDDAGKLTHIADGTLCDYNRSGSPLMEIVSEPDLASVSEASIYAEELRRILRYVGASECDMEKGMMRFDANISIRKKGDKKLGVKVEIKNLNSFRSLEQALAYEIKRQEKALDEGEKIEQETRGWDPDKGETFSQRSKEEAHDYRYFPEPDLPPISLSPKHIAAWKKEIIELPLARKQRFVRNYGLPEKDASTLTESRLLADYFEKTVSASGDPKISASFLITLLLGRLYKEGITLAECKISAEALGELVKLIKEGIVSNNLAKTEIFPKMFLTGVSPGEIVKKEGMGNATDMTQLESIAKKVIETNSDAVDSYKKGKAQALGVLTGQIIKETKGQANPKIVNELLRKLLG